MTKTGVLLLLISRDSLRRYLKVDYLRMNRLLRQAGVTFVKGMLLNERECVRVMTVFYETRGEGILRRNGKLSNLDPGSEDFSKHHYSRIKGNERGTSDST